MPEARIGGNTVHFHENHLQIGDHVLKFESHSLSKIVGSGANGIVILARNKFLDRDECIKVWLKIKQVDKRDKIAQGMLEARKLSKAANENVIQPYFAGVNNGYFFITMEYFDSKTLKACVTEGMNESQSLYSMYRYIELMENITIDGAYHGDPHAGNILVGQGLINGKYRACDFGTSLYLGRQGLRARHWAVMDETVKKIGKRLREFGFIEIHDKYVGLGKHKDKWSDDEYFARYKDVVKTLCFGHTGTGDSEYRGLHHLLELKMGSRLRSG